MILILIIAFIIISLISINISLADKSLLSAKIYTFIFEHDDWLLYKKAKKHDSFIYHK